MSTAMIEEIKVKIVPILKDAGVVRSSLFGSVVRDEATATSDIDILVEFKPERLPGLFGFAGLQHRLEEALGRKVDLLTFQSINPLLKNNIMRDVVNVL